MRVWKQFGRPLPNFGIWITLLNQFYPRYGKGQIWVVKSDMGDENLPPIRGKM